MSRSRLFGIASALALALLTVGAPAASAASHAVLMVDDDGHAAPGNCDASAATYSSIQDAIDAASAGDSIRVCPGDYTENLIIRAAKDNLSLVSVSPFQARIWRPTSLDGDTPMVNIRPGADGVRFIHFSLLFPTTDACDQPSHDGILVEGRNAVIRGNRIKSDGPDDFNSCGFDVGVQVGLAVATAKPLPPASALVGWNLVRGFHGAGIWATGPTSRMRATRNSVHYGHEGSTECITAAAGLGSRSYSPAGSVCVSAGVAYSDGASGKVDGNRIFSDVDFARPQTAQPAPILANGIIVGAFSPAGPVKVVHNRVHAALDGIEIAWAEAGRVRGNAVWHGVDTGITLETSTGVLVKANRVTLSWVGINANASSGGNAFRANTALGNDSYDCQDLSSGPSNTWAHNVGDSSNPSGLCVNHD
jgi:Periplasmic copper-binding protein (NosD)